MGSAWTKSIRFYYLLAENWKKSNPNPIFSPSDQLPYQITTYILKDNVQILQSMQTYHLYMQTQLHDIDKQKGTWLCTE